VAQITECWTDFYCILISCSDHQRHVRDDKQRHIGARRANAVLKLAAVQRKVWGILGLLEHGYRHSHLRNKILAMKSRRRTDRLASGSKRFVVFLVPGRNIVNGGIISICSIASESKKLLAMNGVSVAVCTAYDEPRMLRFTKFDNEFDLLAFSDLLPRFPSGAEVLVHIPELFVQKYVSDCRFVYRSRPDLIWRYNILLQNIDLTPPKEAVEILQQMGTTTATINHKASAEIARRLGCPIHYLSWGLCAENFERVEYSRKENKIVISPDSHPAKYEIVRQMAAALPDHKIIEIRNMTYEKYKSILKQAKFTFTFGEGLDGYFVESIFSGGVAMAMFTERFFTAEYRDLDGIFSDGKHAIAGVADFLKATNNEMQHQTIANRQHDLVAKTFVREQYLQNIRSFYENFYPEWNHSAR
jgi:hypothetical protein